MCKWQCLPLSHLPANRHDDLGWNEVLRTRPHTPGCGSWSLMVPWACGYPGETQLLVLDVDCKYLSAVYTTQVEVFPGMTVLICCIIKQQVSRWLFLFGLIWTLCMEQWEESLVIWRRPLLATDFMITPHLHWWWNISKKNLVKLRTHHLKKI